MQIEATDRELLARAVGLALDNVADGQLPFGALVVDAEGVRRLTPGVIEHGAPYRHRRTASL